MRKETISYVDYDGNQRTEDFFFNITNAELAMLELSEVGGFKKKMTRIIQAQDGPAILKAFRDIVKMSYGVKSDDGRRHIKSEEVFAEFAQTEAYSELIMRLLGDEKYAAEFIADVLPKEVAEKMAKQEGGLSVVQ